MARPPAFDKDDETRTFEVSRGHSIVDNDGVRKFEGDHIELTHPQAQFHKRNGSIEVPLENFNAPDTKANADTTQNNDDAGADNGQASGGGETQGQRKPAVGSTRKV